MQTVTNSILGLVFLGLGIFLTFLMFKLWGYPFDHETHRSAAPPGLMRLHRMTGYVYLAIYVYLMWQMVPRLWTYQVEFPARTVAHLLFGMTIGVLLLIKIVIVRWFKHLEGTLVPFLGTLLLVATFLLIGLSVPFALKSRALAGARGGNAFSNETVERVRKVLPAAGFPKDQSVEKFASVTGLRLGRDVLMGKCVTCHDLRTVLIRPKAPDSWVQTVQRMSERAIFEPILEDEQWAVAAYLIAISPELRDAAKKRREEDKAREGAKVAVEAASTTASAIVFDHAKAKAIFEKTCSKCHKPTDVQNEPPKDLEAAKKLVARMVDNGLEAPAADLEQIVMFLAETYGKKP